MDDSFNAPKPAQSSAANIGADGEVLNPSGRTVCVAENKADAYAKMINAARDGIVKTIAGAVRDGIAQSNAPNGLWPRVSWPLYPFRDTTRPAHISDVKWLLNLDRYFPTPDDLQTIRTLFPGDVSLPPWHLIQARLIEAGQSHPWADITAPSVIAMLRKLSPPNAESKTPAAKPKTGEGTAENLSDLHRELLEAMRLLKATNHGKRRTSVALAAKAWGKTVNPAKAKKPLAELVRLGLAASVQGRSGGSWLTPEGRKALRETKRKR